MKKRYLWLLLLPFLISSCKAPQPYTFAQGFQDLQLVDTQYDASFQQERLNGTMVLLDQIDPLLAELDKFQENVEKTQDSRDREALLIFIDIRRDMLLSQKNFLLGQKIGDIGLVKDSKGFKCAEAKYLLDTIYYFNESVTYGRRALFDLDNLLYKYQDVQQLQDLVGLNQNKTAFYKSPLDHLKNVIRENTDALAKNCKIKVVTN
ncbi:hypothetical protein HYS50_02015 [Candidatus Woesearchaeota archaeon]|nr:hypothetical protein [Candidatus Woesearchaeota archaeon]